MSEKRININELKGYDSTEGYMFYPPCCGANLHHTIFLSSLIEEGECWNCGQSIDVELVLK